MSDARTDPTDQDRIEREIYIAADAEKVWELVSRPGWWINGDDVDPEPVLDLDGDVAVLTHPEWGDFAIRIVEVDRPRYASYRWLSAPSAEIDDATSTLVEFFVEEKPGGVTLRVVEGGFETLSDDPAVWGKQRENNDEGWSNELRAARDFVTADRG